MMIQIDGKKLRLLLASKQIRQVDVAGKSGMNKFTLNRWCNGESEEVQETTLRKLARGLGMTLDELRQAIELRDQDTSLSPAEATLLNEFRSLPPLEQAKVLIAFDEMVSQARASQNSQKK